MNKPFGKPPIGLEHTSIPSGFVRVRGARENNLKNIDVDVPRDALVAFTGISGSGKSSLAFGTLYAEAQRPDLSLLRREHHDALEPAAHAVLARGHVSAEACRAARGGLLGEYTN